MENTKNIFKERFFSLVVPVIAVVAILVAAYFYNQIRTLKNNPQIAAEKEVSALVNKVSKLVVLPTGEVPTVATVSDPEALKNQSFFATAEKGDKVLIYTQAKKAILYSVSLNKIIDVAPLNIGNQKAVTPPTTTEEAE